MKCSTEIDTVSIQVDSKNKIEQKFVLFAISGIIRNRNKICIKYNVLKSEYDILFNSNRIGIIKCGENPINNELTGRIDINYYITVSFAGLKSYNQELDKLSYNCLFSACGQLNKLSIAFKFIELDLCIDFDTKMQNVLALCTTKLPRTKYHLADKSFYNGDTVYIEAIQKDRLTYNSQRAYVYNKAKKENLRTPITRFELKLQKSFFLNNELDFITIFTSLDRYTVMYFDNSFDKETVINKYNSYSRVGKRDIDKMGLNRYRVKPDITRIWNFLKYLKDYRLY